MNYKNLFLKGALSLMLLGTISQEMTAQGVGINDAGAQPDASAALDVSSTTKGVLVPRMTTAQRTAVASPAKGLLVFDNTSNSFWFYNGSAWEELAGGSGGSSSALVDADGDTKIQVEELADEDLIRFDMAGTEYFIFEGPLLSVMNSGASVFFGAGAGVNDDLSANANSFIGYNAGNANTSGQFNTAVGNAAMMKTTTGSYSVALGASALLNNLTGTRNTAIGRSAGYAATGSRNVFLGYNAGYNETGSDKLYIDNNSTTTPLIYGDFSTDIATINGRLNVEGTTDSRGLDIDHDYSGSTTSYGADFDCDNTGTSSNYAYGVRINLAKSNNVTNAYMYGVRSDVYDSQEGTGARIATGVFGYANASSTIGTSTVRGIYGNAGGNADNKFAGYFVGDAYATGIFQTSDRKLKTNIREYKGALAQLDQLTPKVYNYKKDRYPHMNLPEGEQVGLIAQEVQQVFPDLVKRADDGPLVISKEVAIAAGYDYKESEEEGMVEVGEYVEFLAVNYTNLVPVLIQATKEQQTIIETQQAKIDAYEARLQRIEKLLLENQKEENSK
ncbi:MAG: tail fiber domain-containing protein [Aureispira sp.]|nr:tail fiber domain-containing protein [Aureispira sp.]